MKTPARGADDGGIGQDRRFVRRVLLVIGLVALTALLWRLSGTLLLVFAAILIAVVFRALARLLERWIRIPSKISLYVAVALVIAVAAGAGWLFGTRIQGQITDVVNRLPELIDDLGRRIGIEDATAQLRQLIRERTDTPGIVGRAAGFGYTAAGALADSVIVLIAAVYLAYDPKLYRRGFLSLFPPANRPALDRAILATARALRQWLVGQLVTMVAVGILSGLGYWLIGLPAPIALGIIAGLTNFIPFLGPILGAIPALVFAVNMSMETTLYALAVMFAVQQVEGNILVPVIQREAVSLPPALALFAIIFAGVLFGFAGVLFAVPLAVAIMVLVDRLWVRGVLARAPPG